MALTLKAMEYFTTALRHGNIAKAAVELNIAASAISSAIDQVETEFDLTLVTVLSDGFEPVSVSRKQRELTRNRVAATLRERRHS